MIHETTRNQPCDRPAKCLYVAQVNAVVVMKEHDDTFSVSPLPSGVNSGSSTKSTTKSVPHTRDLIESLPTMSNGQLTPSGGGHGTHSSHQHSSKSDRFRCLEDRIDGLQEQLTSTQIMIRELTDLITQQQRSTTARQNLRALSGKALKAQGPPGARGSFATQSRDGPPSSATIVSTFISSLESTIAGALAGSDIVPDTSMDTPVDTIPELPEQQQDIVSEPVKPRQASDQNRKVSASNPIALMNEKTPDRKASRAIVISHASTFVNEITKAASQKRLGLPNKTNATNGPEISRRFSISSLDQSGVHSRDSRMSWAVKWSRNLFRHRVEPQVSPEDIMHARTSDTRVHPLTFRHDTAQRLMWDTIVILLIIIDIAVTPLSLSFRFTSDALVVYNEIANVFFGIDFVVNMFSSYTTKRGDLVSGPRRTVPHYMLSPWSVPDFLSWFPFGLLLDTAKGRFLGIAKVIRLVRISYLARRLHSTKKAGVFRFVQLLGIVFIVSHCLACYWNAIATEWQRQEEGYLDLTLGQQYAHCWSIIIGSLNASPPQMHTTIEEVSVACIMLIGNVLQATVFGAVAVLISSFDEEEVAYNKKLISTYERCRFLGIPEPLAKRIQGYYENLYRETRSVNTDADSFINELSPALICEVKFQLYRDMIKQIPFLSATHINPVVIEMLILHLRTVIYMQDDVLIRKCEFGDWMGFIGSKGFVGVLDPNSEARKIIRILRKGDYFGEMALLQRAKRSTTAIALSWVQIHVLCRNDLDDVKEQYPEQAQILEDEITKYMKSKVRYK